MENLQLKLSKDISQHVIDATVAVQLFQKTHLYDLVILKLRIWIKEYCMVKTSGPEQIQYALVRRI